MSASLALKLDEETRQRLQALGQLRDRSPHWLMRKAVLEYLEREERYEQEKREDLARWERHRLDGAAIPQAAMRHWLEEFAQGRVAPPPATEEAG
ncbi:CopG family ribbon-helix-helix protein [Pseudoroseomonas cervicalis]|uniref:Ribbon-helix-helix protein, CopG family n=1 Tax=Pseudoroseomonas cervicalis ATCC 49957 TaxID=525371 RepID=D5RGT7_9PROT|nr:ribbon-helix-helix protein, CopG family [Pseudoroseomonas cervicalis]EFH13498.1 Ribbon-helix-helix protein, CopG family [Pseudoroseomonas cervicalis ATCC 49957]